MSEHALITTDQLQGLLMQQYQQQETLLVRMAAMIEQQEKRIAALERRCITINSKQAKALSKRIGVRAQAVSDKYSLSKKSCGSIRTAIRREVLRQYGIADLHDLPVGYYELAGQLVDGWSSYTMVRKLRDKEAGL